VFIALDVASSELWDNGKYVFKKSGSRRARPTRWSSSTSIGCASIRSSRSKTASPKATGTDGRLLTRTLGDRVQLVGDDVFVTNPEILRRGIR
jgi:enolase